MPPTADRQLRISRIKKLMALASDQAGTPEGAAAARIARRLMREQAIALSELDHDTRRRIDPFQRCVLELGGRETWRRRLANQVAVHCGCLLTWSSRTGRVRLYGPQSGVEIAEYLFTVFEREITAARTGHDPGTDDPAEVDRARRDFCLSAVLALGNRLRATRDGEVSIDPTGAALVRARDADLREWMAERGYAFGAAPPPGYRYSQAGYEAGHAIPMFDAVGLGPEGELTAD